MLSAVVAVHTAVLLFGFAGLFGKWLTLPPSVIVLGRTAVAAAVLALVVALQRERFRFQPALATNGFVLAVHWVTFFEAIRVSSVAIGLCGFATFPLFVLAIESRHGGRRPDAVEWATVALVITGFVVLVPSFDVLDATLQGLAWGLASGFTFALLTVRTRDLRASFTPAGIAFWQNFFAAVVLLPFAWLARNAVDSLTARDLGLLIALGVFCTALAHTLFIASLRHLSAQVASVIAALEPVYGIALAAWLLQEIPTPRTLLGAALIVAAAILATRRSTQGRL